MNKNPNTVNLSIPLNTPFKDVINDIRHIVRKKQKNDTFDFKYSENFKGIDRYRNLEIYNLFWKGKPPINEKFSMISEKKLRIDQSHY